MSKETLAVDDLVRILDGDDSTFRVTGTKQGWIELEDGTKHRAKALEFVGIWEDDLADIPEGEFNLSDLDVPDDDEDEEEDGGKESMSSHMAKYRAGYVACQSSGGSASMNNGDSVAQLLQGCTPLEAIALAEKLADMDAGTLKAKYEHLNEGAKRMNAGNRVRGAIKRGDFTEDEVVAIFAAL